MKRRPWRVTLWIPSEYFPHRSSKLNQESFSNTSIIWNTIDIWFLFCTDHSGVWQSNSFIKHTTTPPSSPLARSTFFLWLFLSDVHKLIVWVGWLVSLSVGLLVSCEGVDQPKEPENNLRLKIIKCEGKTFAFNFRKCEGKTLGCSLTSSSWRPHQ